MIIKRFLAAVMTASVLLGCGSVLRLRPGHPFMIYQLINITDLKAWLASQ